jgi:serine/threonine protein kinase
VVYAVRDKRLNRRLALKAVLPGNDGKRGLHAEQFIREARVLAGLTREPDANIPTIHTVTENDGQLFYVREYVEGPTLEQAAADACINLPGGLRILSSLAEAVGRVHALGVAHRNLNPSNVLIAAANCPKLIGFGKCAPLGQTYPQRGSSCVSADIDNYALHEVLVWLGATLRQPLPARLAETLRHDTVLSPAELAHVLRQSADEELPD